MVAPSEFQSDVAPVLDPVPERLVAGKNLVLTWPKVEGANHYVLQGAISNQSLHVRTPTNSYVLRAMAEGRYQVYLRAEQGTSPSSLPSTSRLSERIEWIVTGNIADLRLENDFRDPSLRELKWKAIPGVNRYEISFDATTENKTVAAIADGNKYALPRSIPAEASTVYVRGISADGTATEWSSGLDVNQVQEPQLNPVVVDSLYTRRFSWEPVPTATGYDVLIRHVDSHKYLPGGYNIQGTEVVAEKLLEGRYEWIVGPRGIPGESLWSPVAEHVIDLAPVLSVPVAFESLDASKLVQWSAIDGAEFYDLWVTDYFNNTVIRETRSSQTEYDLKSRLPAGRYIVYVRVVTSEGQFLRWGQSRHFTINDEQWPYLTVPASFQASEQKKLIDWQDVPGACVYEIWITNDRFVRVVHQRQIGRSSFDLGSSLAWDVIVSGSGH
jgi:hypothetical protein